MPSEYGLETDAITLQRFVLHEQTRFPKATGDLTNLLTSLVTAVKAVILLFIYSLYLYRMRGYPRLS